MKKKAVIIIPARKGSKRIKNKNIINLCSKPLISYTIENALTSKFSDEIFISTDCDDIKKICKNYPVCILDRPKKFAGDLATSESVLIHALDEIKKKKNEDDPEFTIFLQCTSPIRKIGEIDEAFKKIKNFKGDSLISVTESKKFLWKYKKNKFQSINYDFKKRQREQDFEKQFEENGSIYIIKSKLLRKEKNRLCGKIIPFIMNPFSSLQIDEKDDLKLARLIMSDQKVKLNFKNIKLIDLDSLNLNKVDFIKIDVEGLGIHVLKGMANTLIVCDPVVCVELFEEVEKVEQMKFMHSMGYDLVDIIKKEHVFKKK